MKAATVLDGVEKWTLVFQSTPPVKAATGYVYWLNPVTRISIHAAREGGDAAEIGGVINGYISIHAAREGGDGVCTAVPPCTMYFNPRRP